MRFVALLCSAVVTLVAPSAHAFCGFYVAKADAALFNHASQVVLVRDGERTVLTMSNDFQGPLTEFALVVPVPTVLTREQIHVGDPALVRRLDAYSGPRLVEYFDPDPCQPVERDQVLYKSSRALAAPMASTPARARSLGVTVEAEYTVGEYDIAILSAKESTGLQTYLTEQGYRIPPKAAAALEPYLKQDMKFFVAKVNLKEQAKTGFRTLRPLQMAYESKKFMLPIRLGMANADGPQDLIVYALTRRGRVESTNYRTVKLPTNEKVPLFVKSDFPKVYKSIFETAWQKEDRRAVFTEYAWSSAWCDPCADSPLTPSELRGLGVFWLDETQGNAPPLFYRRGNGNGATPFVTRLHVRYDRDHFPEDLVFQETADQENYQARYVLQHPFTGDLSCAAADSYRRSLDDRRAAEVTTLASLTGWPRERILSEMGPDAPQGGPRDERWYQHLWK